MGEAKKNSVIDEYTFHQFDVNSDADLTDLAHLFAVLFKKKVATSYLKQKYDTQYLEIPPVAFMARKGGEVAAFYGAIPQQFCNGKERIKVAHACDSLTLETHQRKGLHTRLAELSYAKMREYGIRLVYAFHSKNTHRSTVKLGWKDFAQMHFVELHPLKLPLSQLKHRLKLPNSALDKMAKQFDEIIAPTQNDNRISECFNASLLKYRNFTNNKCLCIGDVVFWFKLDAILHVGAFSAPSAEALQKALATLMQFCKKNGISKILFQVDESSENYAQLAALNYNLQPSWIVGGLELLTPLPLADFKFDYHNLDTF